MVLGPKAMRSLSLPICRSIRRHRILMSSRLDLRLLRRPKYRLNLIGLSDIRSSRDQDAPLLPARPRSSMHRCSQLSTYALISRLLRLMPMLLVVRVMRMRNALINVHTNKHEWTLTNLGRGLDVSLRFRSRASVCWTHWTWQLRCV